MNFYKHHIGDYAATTSHLSFVEDAAFSRLLRIYYRDERPLPSDIRAVQRLASARSKEERVAVESVLREFFTEMPDGWRNSRCDEELAKATAQAETNRRIAVDREARRRSPSQSTGNDSWVRREPSQTPDPKLHTRDLDNHCVRDQAHFLSGSMPMTVPMGTAKHASRLMLEAGCKSANAHAPELVAALEEGISPEALAETAREAIANGATNPFRWAIATARGRQNRSSRESG